MSVMTVARAARQGARLPLPHDPGLAGTRRGARAALVVPLAFAFAKLVIGNPQFATFTAFGCFALLVLADFGGTRRPRSVAYAVTTLVGATLVAVGTLASSSPWLAAAVMLLIGFGVQFAGIFGGYVAAAQTALLLSFVLAVSIPATATTIGVRLAGWCLAGLLSLLAGVFLWPRFERVTLRQQAAVACRALASMIVAQREGPMGDALARRVSAARDAVGAVRRSFAATPKRPAALLVAIAPSSNCSPSLSGSWPWPLARSGRNCRRTIRASRQAIRSRRRWRGRLRRARQRSTAARCPIWSSCKRRVSPTAKRSTAGPPSACGPAIRPSRFSMGWRRTTPSASSPIWRSRWARTR